jgi:hypothetical protein
MTNFFKWIKKNRKNIAHFYWATISPIVVYFGSEIPDIASKIYVVVGLVLSANGYTKETITQKPKA